MNVHQEPIWTRRSAGAIVPILSLDSDYGCGDFEAACRMFDYLGSCGITTVMLLPVGPIGYGNSPYAPQSSVGGCPYFISPDWLCRDGLVTKDDCAQLTRAEQSSLEKVDYGILYTTRIPFLQTAFFAFEQDERNRHALDVFIAKHAWLAETVLFLSIKSTQNGRAWWEWSDAHLKAHDARALAAFKQDNAALLRLYWFVQFIFHNQMTEMCQYAKAHHVQLVGDMPFYLAPDSADVWAHRHLFSVDPETGELLLSGGAPSSNMHDGPQIWGNPIYNWDEYHADVLRWWKDRLNWYAQYFAGLRIDHATALKEYYCATMDGKHAEWRQSPFDELCALINDFSQTNQIQIICEDLGVVPDGLRERFEDLGWFGMRVIQYINITHLNPADESNPDNYPENALAFTGTHDNLPLKACLEIKMAGKMSLACAIAGVDEAQADSLYWVIVDKIYQSKAKVCVIQLQDLLETGQESTLVNGSQSGSAWTWRVPAELLTKQRANKFRDFAVASQRIC